MKTIRSIKLPDNYFAVLRELAGLHGQTIEQFCAETLKYQIEDIVDNDYEHIGRLVCSPWKKALAARTQG